MSASWLFQELGAVRPDFAREPTLTEYQESTIPAKKEFNFSYKFEQWNNMLSKAVRLSDPPGN
ncbi:MAG: hypothetical protein DMG36_16555 [Acidobacteria bacterium]|nr:MAG: hypothetical protein DMG36_16555 [Acidobacteriota bacterium]